MREVELCERRHEFPVAFLFGTGTAHVENNVLVWVYLEKVAALVGEVARVAALLARWAYGVRRLVGKFSPSIPVEQWVALWVNCSPMHRMARNKARLAFSATLRLRKTRTPHCCTRTRSTWSFGTSTRLRLTTTWWFPRCTSGVSRLSLQRTYL